MQRTYKVLHFLDLMTVECADTEFRKKLPKMEETLSAPTETTREISE